jgi:Mn-dependent DtxR family transcriptional regulator
VRTQGIYTHPYKRPGVNARELGYGGGVTPRQCDYLRAISRVSERLGYPPSLREVATEMSTSVSTTTDTVISLERQGLVARSYATARSLRLTDAGRTAIEGKAA